FGKPVQNIDQPGAYFKWPWPIQKVYKFDHRVQNFEDKFSQTLTRDNNNLIVTIYTGWRISDASAFYPKFLGSVPAAQGALENMLRNAKNAVIGQHDLSDFVNTDPKQLKFDEIEAEIQQSVQANLSTNNYGISLEFLGLKKIELPESVTASVFERMKADRQLLINKEQYEGEKEATIIRADADRQAAETIANAQAAAIRIRGEAEAAAAPTLRVFEKNPELYIFLLRIEAMKESMNQKTTLIFDDRTPPFDLFQHLPTNSVSQ
ncbi:MAG TPA: protease modulator HflC, partial [Candidatus Angelobacter sp.]|nr:protease modulator HflC [Candidatus Angelobacter sp.]